jgi:cytoskeletal protein CcmA (bactofilin family)
MEATLIDTDGDVEGKLRGKNARILGRFRGDIELTGRLEVGESARVEAKVKADAAEIAGELKGELSVRSLVLLEKARVSGRFDAKTLAVREGAQVNGAVEAGEALKSRPAVPVATAPRPAPAPGVVAG